MVMLLLGSVVALVVPLIIVLAVFVLSMRSMGDREKLSPFECGFDPYHKARIPFSTRFFLLAIIFIVFDIEIVLLMPIPLINLLSNLTILVMAEVFIVILFLGLIHEWNQGSLNWSN